MRILKKYPNRRIYDTQTSSFVALAEIRQMIIDRESIQVVHSKTGKDLTRSVLMQVITEMESEGHESLLTNRVLEELIRFYGDKLVAMMGPYLEQQILQSLASQDRWREQLTKAFTQPYPSPDQAFKQMLDHYKTITGQKPPPGKESADNPPSKEQPAKEQPASENAESDAPNDDSGK